MIQAILLMLMVPSGPAAPSTAVDVAPKRIKFFAENKVGPNQLVFVADTGTEQVTGVYPPTIWHQEKGAKTGTQSIPPIVLNLLVIFAVNHEDYKEGLKLLSKVIEFFHANSVFNQAHNDDLPKAKYELQDPFPPMGREALFVRPF